MSTPHLPLCHHRPHCAFLIFVRSLLGSLILLCSGINIGLAMAKQVDSGFLLGLFFLILCDLRINVILTRRRERDAALLSPSSEHTLS